MEQVYTDDRSLDVTPIQALLPQCDGRTETRVALSQRAVIRIPDSLVFRWREASILLAGALLAVYFQSTNSAFLSTSNIENLIDYTATTAIIAAGEVMVPVCGELDLSVGMVYALTPFVMCFAMAAGLPTELAVVIALAAAGVVGLINGAVTTLLNVPAFVTTLGTMFLVNGLTLTISGGFPVEPQAAPAFAALFGGSPWARLGWALALALALALQYVLNRTRFGLHSVATGGNPIAAAEVGIRVTSIKIRNFVLCSMLGEFAGVIDAFRIGSIDPLAGGSEITFAAIAPWSSAAALDRWLRDGDRRLHRRPRAWNSKGRLHPPGRQRLHLRYHPRGGHSCHDGGQRPPHHVARSGRR